MSWQSTPLLWPVGGRKHGRTPLMDMYFSSPTPMLFSAPLHSEFVGLAAAAFLTSDKICFFCLILFKISTFSKYLDVVRGVCWIFWLLRIASSCIFTRLAL